ncbi:MAG TPA: zinc-ribbon domain-containing protein [Candidatus Binatia bacterium]|nr:zinc-ribbon domain-containing protein [Candidatus Binatia bacterium]
MTIHCPRCRTRYRLPARTRHGADVTYRCARCGLVFHADAPAPERRRPAPPALDDEDDEAGFTLGDPEDAAPDDAPQPSPRAAGEEVRPVTTPARFALRALTVVTLGYAVLSIYLYTHPGTASGMLGRVPFLGPRLTEAPMSPDSIQLADVQGAYQRVQNDELVFVISGVAINNSRVAVRGIQIEGRIAGAREQRQVIFCGTAPRGVEDLSPREIGLLQTLEPPKDWALGPGEQTSFQIVFVQPPTDLRELSAEVVAVQGRRRRAGAPFAQEAAALLR